MRLLKKIALYAGLGVVGLMLTVVLVFFVSSLMTTVPGQAKTPSGLVQDRALYIVARDGTRLAADVWLPADYRSGQRLPTILHTTRYWRAIRWSWIVKGAYGLGLFPMPDTSMDIHFFLNHGYAVVSMDARGSGASDGRSTIPVSPDEVRDLDDVAHWIVKQPWSNGRIGSMGVSYNGRLAEFAASIGNPAIRAVAPLYASFDSNADYLPGGVGVEGFIHSWSEFVQELDSNDICFQYGLKCRLLYAPLIRGVKPVDDDPDGRVLADIVARRHNIVAAEAVRNMHFRDDLYATTGLTYAERAPYAQKAAIEASHVPMFVMDGWLDSIHADGAFSRYRTFSNDQLVTVGALSHGGTYDTDPFAPTGRAAVPSENDFNLQLVRFFDRTVKPEHPSAIGRRILYSTLGAGTKYRETATWPPTGMIERTLFLSADHRLVETSPSTAEAIRYKVDLSATTGDSNRWYTTAKSSDVIYPDRRAEDRKLLTFTSDPFPENTEITGTPVLNLEVSSSRDDNAFFVYLEDVAPDGRVTYITEGILRGYDRKVSASPPYATLGPYHSLLRADMEPMVPGQIVKLGAPLAATSVLIRKGHRLHIALAGADTSVFERVPKSGKAPEWLVQTGGESASVFVFPVRPWSD